MRFIAKREFYASLFQPAKKLPPFLVVSDVVII